MLSLEGAEGNRGELKKFEAAGPPNPRGEGESVAGCDISVNDLCCVVITLASFKKGEFRGGSPCGAGALVAIRPSHSPLSVAGSLLLRREKNRIFG